MTAKEISDRKKYRSAFIIYALLAAAGIGAGIYVFKYTSLLSGTADGYVFICRMDASELFIRYFGEARYLVILYLCGFTVFAVPAAIAFAILRGFVCSAGILRLASACAEGRIGTAQLVIAVFAAALILIIEILMAAKSVCQSERLKYVAPAVGELIRDPEARRYSAAFAMLCGFMFIAVAAAYFAPLITL